MTKNCWEKADGSCLETAPVDAHGFIYLIEATGKSLPSEVKGKIYVGKKQFTFRKKTKLSRANKKLTGKRVKVEQVDSKWQSYWGSCKPLLEDIAKYGEENFTRKILMFTKNKSENTYYELKFQLQYEVLLVPSYNGWISGRVYRKFLI